MSWEASRHEGPHRRSFEVRYAKGALERANLGPDCTRNSSAAAAVEAVYTVCMQSNLCLHKDTLWSLQH